jgi:hypothetical protein
LETPLFATLAKANKESQTAAQIIEFSYIFSQGDYRSKGRLGSTMARSILHQCNKLRHRTTRTKKLWSKFKDSAVFLFLLDTEFKNAFEIDPILDGGLATSLAMHARDRDMFRELFSHYDHIVCRLSEKCGYSYKLLKISDAPVTMPPRRFDQDVIDAIAAYEPQDDGS